MFELDTFIHEFELYPSPCPSNSIPPARPATLESLVLGYPIRLIYQGDGRPGLDESRESLLAAINSWARPRGYAFTTEKSLKTSSGRIKVIPACDGNKPPPSASIERQRRTCSRRPGYKISVLAKESLDRNTRVLGHRPDKECSRHNHPPSPDASAHPTHRQLNERDAAIVSSLTTAGTSPQHRSRFCNSQNIWE